jgi:alpha-glucosidase
MLTAVSIILLLSGFAGHYQDEEDETSFEPFPVVRTGDSVIEPPEGVHPFYKKYVNADGIVIVGSENVADAALLTARRTILRLTSQRPDVHQAIVANNARISIMAFSETASDLPEFGPGADGEWGLGQMPGDPTSLVSERGIPYEGNAEYIANFLLHEFVHVVHNLAMPTTDPEIVDEIYGAYLRAVENGLFMKPPNEPAEEITAFDEYRDDEYFTHSVNAYYDLNESLPGPWVDIEIGEWGQRSGTREELRRNDPRIYEIIEQFFPDSLED